MPSKQKNNNGDDGEKICQSPPAKHDEVGTADATPPLSPPEASVYRYANLDTYSRIRIYNFSYERRVKMSEDFSAAFVPPNVHVWALPIDYDSLDFKGKSILHRMMSPDFSWSPGKPSEEGRTRTRTTFIAEFETFCSKKGMDVWKQDDYSRVFFEEKHMRDYMVIRRQRSGNCYMHAVVAFVHYLIAKRTNNFNHEMVDISEYMRTHMGRCSLREHIRGKPGGHSLTFLESITGIKRSELYRYYIDLGDPETILPQAERLLEIFNELKEPALVHRFSVEKKFADPDNKDVKFDGEVNTDDLVDDGNSGNTTHAMILIGAYKNEDTGDIYFLLQNWWEGKYLRQVSAQYLASAGATISFVSDVNVAILPNGFHMVDTYYAEGAESPMEGQDLLNEPNVTTFAIVDGRPPTLEITRQRNPSFVPLH
jgi:hypothetical protein